MHSIILAATTYAPVNDSSTGAFWVSDIGEALKAILVGVGILVVIVAALKAIKDVTAGKPGAAAKTVIAAAVLAAFMFQPTLVESLINTAGDVVNAIFNSLTSIIDNKGSAPK